MGWASAPRLPTPITRETTASFRLPEVPPPVRSHQALVDYPDVPVPNAAAGPLAGVTFAVKDIYDVAG